MPFCPNCKTEYREGFDTCNACLALLINELPQEPLSPIEKLRQTPLKDCVYDAPTLLTVVDNDMACAELCELLEFEGIPTLKKYRGLDAYLSIYIGRNNESIEIHVPKGSYEKAMSVIDKFKGGEICELSQEDIAAEEAMNKKRRPKAWLVLFWAWVVMPIAIPLLIKGLERLGWVS